MSDESILCVTGCDVALPKLLWDFFFQQIAAFLTCLICWEKVSGKAAACSVENKVLRGQTICFRRWQFGGAY